MSNANTDVGPVAVELEYRLTMRNRMESLRLAFTPKKIGRILLSNTVLSVNKSK